MELWNIRTWNPEPGTWNIGTLEHWNLEPGTWNLEPGTLEQWNTGTMELWNGREKIISYPYRSDRYFHLISWSND